jgi:predicted enzyme related to lactoylglutathione lyase
MAHHRENDVMLLNGIHHVAILTADTHRLINFYQSAFDAVVEDTSVDGRFASPF